MAYKGHRINPKGFEKGQIKIYLMVIPMVLLCGLPIIFIFFHAFKPMEELFAFPPRFITVHPTLDNFAKLLKASRTGSIPVSAECCSLHQKHVNRSPCCPGNRNTDIS